MSKPTKAQEIGDFLAGVKKRPVDVELYDPRRHQSQALRACPALGADKCVFIDIDGKMWAEVEWSETRQAWCIQDAEGHCLSHVESIHAIAATKREALKLAEEMIRDGRLPSPEAAFEMRAQRERVKVRR